MTDDVQQWQHSCDFWRESCNTALREKAQAEAEAAGLRTALDGLVQTIKHYMPDYGTPPEDKRASFVLAGIHALATDRHTFGQVWKENQGLCAQVQALTAFAVEMVNRPCICACCTEVEKKAEQVLALLSSVSLPQLQETKDDLSRVDTQNERKC